MTFNDLRDLIVRIEAIYVAMRRASPIPSLTGPQLLLLALMPDEPVMMKAIRGQSSNAHYNVSKLVELGLLDRETGEDDRRATWVSIMASGKEVREIMKSALEAYRCRS